MPPTRQAVAFAVDGAILHAQFDTAATALKPLRRVLRLLAARA